MAKTLTDAQLNKIGNDARETRVENQIGCDTSEESFDSGFESAKLGVFEKLSLLHSDGYINANTYNTLILELFPEK